MVMVAEFEVMLIQPRDEKVKNEKKFAVTGV